MWGGYCNAHLRRLSFEISQMKLNKPLQLRDELLPPFHSPGSLTKRRVEQNSRLVMLSPAPHPHPSEPPTAVGLIGDPPKSILAFFVYKHIVRRGRPAEGTKLKQMPWDAPRDFGTVQLHLEDIPCWWWCWNEKERV